MTPIDALQVLEQIAASCPMPLAGHAQAQKAVATLMATLKKHGEVPALGPSKEQE